MTGYYERHDLPENLSRFVTAKSGQSLSPAAHFCWIGWHFKHYSNNDTRGQIASELVSTALKCGLRWDEDDLKQLTCLSVSEHHYATAIGQHGAGEGRQQANPSFVKAFEKWKNRKPFLFAWDTQSHKRLYVGLTFWWQGLNVKVTSFANDSTSLTAVKYKNQCYQGEGHGKPALNKTFNAWEIGGNYKIVELQDQRLIIEPSQEKNGEVGGAAMIERRFKITPADLRSAERDSKTTLNEWLGKLKALPDHKSRQQLATEHLKELQEKLTPFDFQLLGTHNFDQPQTVAA